MMKLGQILFENWVHYFQILNFRADKDSVEVQILLDGITRTIIKQPNECWSLKQTNQTVQNDLIQLVGNAIGQQFRI